MPVLVVFVVLSWLIHRNRFSHSMDRVEDKVIDLEKFLEVETAAALNGEHPRVAASALPKV